jgi:glycosyltransferase involved in cell wall biosynthesis
MAEPRLTPDSTDIFASLRHRKLSVIVPVFNEEARIGSNLALLISEIEPFFEDYEILVVNDGSTDRTHDSLSKVSHPRVRALKLEKNQGKGSAVREGFRNASGDYVLFIDGGMELHPREIRIFLGLMQLYSADVVLGSKRHPQSQVQYPWIRRLLSAIYQRLIQRLFDLDVTDTQVGLKLFRRAVIDAVLPDLHVDRYGFDLEILALAKRRGFQLFLEAPIQLDYFSFNSRGAVKELGHVVRVGFTVLSDTLKLYRRLRSLK